MAPKLTFKLSLRELIFAFFIVLLPFSLFAEYHTSWNEIAYCDEILCIICIIYTLYFSFKKGIKGNDLTLLILLIVCSLITFVGNFVSKLITSPLPIIVDFICLVKIFIVFIVYKQVAEYDKKKRMIQYLAPLSKLFISISTLCGFISLFFDIGMTGKDVRYGINEYFFVFNNSSRYGLIVACCFLILHFSNSSPKEMLAYKIMTVFDMLLTTKGVVYIILVVYIVLSFIWRRKKETKFTTGNTLILSICIMIASTLQINTYLRDEEGPRMVLLRYGFKTANKYLPFGSGFATYGSDMAARYYSVLYKQYGFTKRYGLNQTYGAFLNDCYLGMVFGEFGYIGAIIFFIMIGFVFVPINKITISKGIKILSLSIFIALIISAIGTAIIKSSIGVFVMCVLGMVCGYDTAFKKAENSAKKSIEEA